MRPHLSIIPVVILLVSDIRPETEGLTLPEMEHAVEDLGRTLCREV